MDVANTPFLVDRLGEDCAPLQFLRELTKNAIEAILDTPNRTGEIVWDVDRVAYDLSLGTLKKLCIIDQGCGMTGPEMVQLINRLSSSRHEQSSGGNFGVGAKIAAATRNHAGVIYRSWKHGQGAMVKLVRHATTGIYGLEQFEWRDGTYEYWVPIDDDVKPTMIGEHGTAVTLYGNAEEDNTSEPPAGSGALYPARWIVKYLNARFYSFPAGVTVKAREGANYPEGDDRNRLRPVAGQKAFLDEHSTAKGSVPLTGAEGHWWILEDGVRETFPYQEANGHVAALYQDELYEMVGARSGSARLQQFGVIFGYQRVVLYVEPKNGTSTRVTSNTARTQLLLAGQPLPWAEWAEEFRTNLPQAIKDLMDEITAGASSGDHRQAIKERLRMVRELFRMSRYRPAPRGDLELGDGPAGGPRRPRLEVVSPDDGPRPTIAEPQTPKPRSDDVYKMFLKAGGIPGEEQSTKDNDPEVVWVSVLDQTRASGYLEDRAAHYLRDQHLLQINADFRGFQDMIDRWLKQYPHAPEKKAREIVVDVVHEWFEQSLIETVIGTLGLRGAKYWSPDDLDRALSDEALTAAVMQRYHIDVSVKRVLGSKLGALGRAAS